MRPDRLEAIERLFHEVRDLPDAERSGFLARACEGDSALRREVESLLSQPDGLIDAPVATLVAALEAVRLEPGAAVGDYRIEAFVGAGGMGEVYRAHDTALDRTVAIKIIPGQFAASAARMARFEREARLLAQLNHPNIGAIYGVVNAGEVRGLVLEFIDGPTLDRRMAARPLPRPEALRIAQQIATALEAAHDKGVVHRDLKPANVKIADGVVKVIDFGLARAFGIDESPAQTAGLPTVTSAGEILGTAAYMSPEQARGTRVDKRADVWAFGCVLYEMLTGRMAFAAPTASETLAKILEREPDWTAIPGDTPPAMRRLVKRCLRKDPAERLHDIADARLEIADALTEPTEAAPAPRVPPRPWQWLGGVSAAAAALAIALLIFRSINPPPRESPGPLIEFPINLNDSSLMGLAVSPDGKQVAFSTFTAVGPQISIHAFDTGITHELAGAGGGHRPFWSPDGSAVGFFAMDGTIKRVELRDGAVSVVASARGPGGAAWNRDGVLVYSAESALWRLERGRGTPSPIELDDGAGPEGIRTAPQFLPDGRHFLYHLSDPRGGEVRVGSLDMPQTTSLVDTEYPAVFAGPSDVLFLRGTSLMAQPINLESLKLEGSAAPVAAHAAPGWMLGPLSRLISFSASSTGVLAFVKAGGGGETQLSWFVRAGTSTGSIVPPTTGEYLNPAISPDGQRVAVNRMDPATGNWDIWIVDLAREVASRFTSDPAADGDPVWSPDGKQIVFASDRGGQYGLYRKTVDGSGPEELLVSVGQSVTGVAPTDWSADGRHILYNVGKRTPQGWDVWALPLDGERRPVPVVQDNFGSYAARFSPDGKWIAYSSAETGLYEVFVRPFLAAGDRRQISHGGGTHPRWIAGGRELVYWAVPGGLAAVDIDTTESTLRVGPPKPVISLPILNIIDGRPHYDVTRDGHRFLLRQPAGVQRPAISVIVNWPAKVRK